MKKVISLIISLFMFLSISYSQEDSAVYAFDKDSLARFEVFVNVENTPMDVNYKNTLELLTSEDIQRIISISEQSNAEQAKLLHKVSGLLDGHYLFENKVFKQADMYYDLSEEEVKKSFKRNNTLSLFIYGLIFLILIWFVWNIKKAQSFSRGSIELNRIILSTLEFVTELFVLWYVIKPILSIVFNQNYEHINFLLKGY